MSKKINNFIEKETITIKGKDYTFLKPTAVEIIELQDSCFSEGKIDVIKYARGLLGMISKELKVEDFVKFNPKEVELHDGSKFTFPEIPYEKWAEEIAKQGKFSRAAMAKIALASSGVEGNITLQGMNYNDIHNLAMGYFELYDDSDLKEITNTIENFCI